MVDAAETGDCGPIAEWTESGRRRGESLEWSGAAEVTGADAPGQGLDSPMTPLKTRILLADDHSVVRDGLRMLLDAEPDLRVVAQAGDGAEAVTAGLVDDFGLAVLDIATPRMTGL
jgi:PleD family two-component response regulator